MTDGAFTPATYPYDVVRLACPKCGRRGQYRRDTLIERFGADAAMPDVLRQLADCERWADFSNPCAALYPDLAKR